MALFVVARMSTYVNMKSGLPFAQVQGLEHSFEGGEFVGPLRVSSFDLPKFFLQ